MTHVSHACSRLGLSISRQPLFYRVLALAVLNGFVSWAPQVILNQNKMSKMNAYFAKNESIIRIFCENDIINKTFILI